MTYLLMGNSMKDFYKILGVKENASEEEIRARWIELTKHYHPDRGEDMASDEKIREINEAYQILKHSSTRVEYDLQRAYGQEKRGSYFKKLSIPASLLIIFIIVGIIYFKNPQTPPDSKLTVPNTINSIAQKLPDAKDSINSNNTTNSTNSINPATPATQKPFVASTPKPIASSIQQTPRRIDVPTQQPQLATSTLAVPITLNQRNQTDETDQTNQTNQTDQTNQRNQIDPKLQLAQFKPPSLLATEDEVKKFFGNYIELYNRMDIEGFLSLFSSKAIQNKIYGLGGIRKIYTDFFNQGQEVRCQIQDIKIEIYQNAVEVKARYVIEQVLKMGGGKGVWRGNVHWVLGKENGALKIISLDYQHQKSV
jgi:curved DNA-binding protein CbpA